MIATQLLTDEQSKSIYSDFKNIEIGYMNLKISLLWFFFQISIAFHNTDQYLWLSWKFLIFYMYWFILNFKNFQELFFQLENIGQLQNNKAVFYSRLLDTNKILILDINFACNIVFPQLKLKTNQTKTDWMPLWGFWFYRVYLIHLLYS